MTWDPLTQLIEAGYYVAVHKNKEGQTRVVARLGPSSKTVNVGVAGTINHAAARCAQGLVGLRGSSQLERRWVPVPVAGKGGDQG